MRVVLVVASMALLAVSGCKVGNQGSLKDLSNFTRSESQALQMNQCRGSLDPDDKQKVEYMASIMPELKSGQASAETSFISLRTSSAQNLAVVRGSLEKSLAAVPVNLQQAFFMAGGKIRVDDNAAAICRGEYQKQKVHARTFVGEGTLATADVDVRSVVPSGDASQQPSLVRNLDISGCWVVVADKFENGTAVSWHPEILLNSRVGLDRNNKAYAPSVEHSTVRLFGYQLSQILAHMDGTVKEDAQFNVSDISAKTNDLFTKEVTKLLKAVRSDIAGKNTRDFFYYQKQLQQLDKDAAKKSSELTSLETAMHHYTFAEAFDSYYCNNDTNKQMFNEFPETYALFKSEDSEGKLKGLAVELDYIDIGTDDKESGWLEPVSGPLYASAATTATGIAGLPVANQYLGHKLAFFRLFRGLAWGVGRVFRRVGQFMMGVWRHVVRPVGQFLWRTVGRPLYRVVSGFARGVAYLGGRIVGHVVNAFSPRYAGYTRMRSFRAAGPFRQGFIDATRVWRRVLG